MNIPGLSEETVNRNADRDSIARGREYLRSGAVKSIRRVSDKDVEGYVQGSDIAPYHITIQHDDEVITSAKCTCPYVVGSWCRHIVATLFAVMDSRGDLSRPLAELLQDLDRGEMVSLIESLIDLYPEIARVIEDEYERRRER